MRSKVVSLLKKPMTGIIISVFVGFIVGAIVLGAAGYNPIEAWVHVWRYVPKTEICFADHHQRDPDHPDRLERIICF